MLGFGFFNQVWNGDRSEAYIRIQIYMRTYLFVKLRKKIVFVSICLGGEAAVCADSAGEPASTVAIVNCRGV